jgi:hypothetical protein
MQCNSRFVAVVGILGMAFFGSMAQTKEPLGKDIPGQTSRWKIQYQFIVPAH